MYPEPDYEPEFGIDITKDLQSLGREDGLCGKNADLDYGGQIKVVSAYIKEGAQGLIAVAEIRPYASIVPADRDWFTSDESYKSYMETAESVICGSFPTSSYGDWDGDYWTLAMNEGNEILTIELTDYPESQAFESDTVSAIPKVCELLFAAIFDYCKEFQDEMAYIAKSIELDNYKK